jgi:hypothetical protein
MLAQGYRPHPLLSPSYKFETEYLTPSQVKDTSLKYSFGGGSFSFRFPVYTGKDWLSATKGKPFIAVLASGGTTVRQMNWDYIHPHRLLTTPFVGVTGVMATGPSGLRNLYLGQISLSMPSENYKFSVSYFRFHGAFIWRRLYHNNRFWHTLGVVYTPVMGKDLPLPVIGGGLKIGNDDQLQLTLPFNVTYTHQFTRQFSISAKLNSNGYYNYLKADSIHDQNPLIFRDRFRKASILFRYVTDRFVVWIPEIGLAGRSNLQLNEWKTQQLSAVYFKLSMQVRFGKRPTASPILNFDPGDSGFDPSYLTE